MKSQRELEWIWMGQLAFGFTVYYMHYKSNSFFTMHVSTCINKGSICKNEAEKILMPKPTGMYILRISNKVWGYSVSVRSEWNYCRVYNNYRAGLKKLIFYYFCFFINFAASEKVKHYVLLATGRKYRFLGNNQPEFDQLAKLLKYYK